MRIWFQSAVEMTATAGPYQDALARHFARVADPSTEVVLHGVEPGTWAGRQPSELFGYPAIFLAALGPAILRNAVRAEREGYDAFVIGTYIEPFLREVRSAIDIPVVSSFEATLLVGCSTAQTLGIVTLNRSLAAILRRSLERHALGSRVGPILPMEPELTEREIIGVFSDPESWLARFRLTASRAVAAGAEAIIPAEAILAVIAASHGIDRVDGATILDGVGLPILYAEMLVHLARRTGWRTGRGFHHAKPPAELMDRFVARLGPVRD